MPTLHGAFKEILATKCQEVRQRSIPNASLSYYRFSPSASDIRLVSTLYECTGLHSISGAGLQTPGRCWRRTMFAESLRLSGKTPRFCYRGLNTTTTCPLSFKRWSCSPWSVWPSADYLYYLPSVGMTPRSDRPSSISCTANAASRTPKMASVTARRDLSMILP